MVEEGQDVVEQHDKDLWRVLEVLKKHQLVVDQKKCHLFLREVGFCGHVLSNGTRRPMPGKLRAIEKWEPPKTVTALRAFLGFTNYYSVYIPNYAKLAARLQDKLQVPRGKGKKGSKEPITWTQEDQEAFDQLKKSHV